MLSDDEQGVGFFERIAGEMSPCPTCGKECWRADRSRPCSTCRDAESEAEMARRLAARPREVLLRPAGVPARYLGAFEDLAAWPRDQAWPDFDAAQWDGSPWLLVIHGVVGSGKTMLGCELLARWLVRRRPVGGQLFVRAADLPAVAFGADRERWDGLRDAPVLLVDDIGRGYKGDAASAVGELIAHRYDEVLPTIVTTNAKVETELGDPATVDRLKTGIHLPLHGRSRRRLDRGAIGG